MSYTRGPGAQHWHSISNLSDGLLPAQSSLTASRAWGTANRAIYLPVIVRSRVIVKKLWYGNGTTATGNWDLGLYDHAGVRLLSKGSTAKATTDGQIVWDCTDTVIGPGIYYLGLASDSTTDTFIGVGSTAPLPAACGVYSEADAFPLPATATFAVPQTMGLYVIAGMYLDTRVS